MEFLSQEQMRSNLDELKTSVEDEHKKLTANRFARENDSEAARQDALVSVLRMISSMGVDFGNPESVQTFLMELEQRDPDLFHLFEDAMNGLLGNESIQNEMGAQQIPQQNRQQLPPQNSYENQTPNQGPPPPEVPQSPGPTAGGANL